MKIIHIRFLLFFLILSACRSDDITKDPPTDTTPTPTTKIVSDVSGIVRSDDNNAIAGVMVRLDDNLTTTNDNGYFQFEDVRVSQGGNLISFEDVNYFQNFKFVYPRLNEKAHVEVTMVERKLATTYSASAGANVEVAGGAKVIMPVDGVMNSDGSAYSGSVNVYAHWYDPSDVLLASTMPGDLRAQNQDGLAVQLATFGMMAVELEGASGQKLQIKEGEKAILSFPLDAALSAQAEATIPLWYLDETTGIWKEEGQATKEGDTYQAEVSHFSFWNCDVPFPLVNITGQLTDLNGEPLVFYFVEISMDNGLQTGFGWTNSDGHFSGKVPMDENLTLRVVGSCFTSQAPFHEQSIPASSVDINLGTIAIDASSGITQITGTLLECNTGLPLTNGYALIEYGGLFKILETDDQGVVSGLIETCGTTEITIRGYDLTSGDYSDAVTVTISVGDIDFGAISMCNQSTEFLNFTFDGVTTAVVGELQAFLVDGTNTALFGIDATTGYFVDVSVPLMQPGVATPEFMEGLGANSTGGSNNFICTAGGIDLPCNIVDMEITSTGNIGNFVEGGFSGLMHKAANGGVQQVPFTGSFKIEIESAFDTRSISGKAWIDENEDGLRDGGETIYGDAKIKLRRSDDKKVNGVNTQNSASIETDGSYTISGIYPQHDYYLEYIGQKSLTLINEGMDESIDNDFEYAPIGAKATPTLQFSGTDYVEVDLGVLTGTTGLTCEVEVIGCALDNSVVVTASGGVAPYSFSLNGVVYSSGNLPLDLAAGVYTVDVIDADQHICTTNFIIEDNSNSVSGRVWEDVAGGSPNVYDSNDILFPGVILYLTDPSTTLQYTTDASGNYNMGNFSQGSYMITLEIPAGYELVEGQFGNDETIDSDFDPNTGATFVTMVVQNCFDMYVLDAGLRKI